ncbi:MAG: 16S rRNA (guanine(966)-N(2))-methyltransferase RsmD [Solobacterium sp.]|nr:16S rRNA (guanine(966)-N(2))-methyltransferase RsmD [Solobacterium sp.]
MRIVAGKYSSRRLDTLPGNDTRPTLDKVREAVFSSLGGFFEGGNMLDLYAGSGAVGLEALSRGMDHIVLVDKSRAAAEIIRKNIASLKAEEQTTVLPVSDLKALGILQERGIRFDLVYLDPPYAKERNMEILRKLQEYSLLAEKARIVIESDKEDVYETVVINLVRYKEAIYGITKISYYQEVDS